MSVRLHVRLTTVTGTLRMSLHPIHSLLRIYWSIGLWISFHTDFPGMEVSFVLSNSICQDHWLYIITLEDQTHCSKNEPLFCAWKKEKNQNNKTKTDFYWLEGLINKLGITTMKGNYNAQKHFQAFNVRKLCSFTNLSQLLHYI